MLIFMTTQDMVDYHHELFNLVIHLFTLLEDMSVVKPFLDPTILIGGLVVT